MKFSYERDNMTQFARELGISVKQLYSWRSQYKIKGTESFPGNRFIGKGSQKIAQTMSRQYGSKITKELEVEREVRTKNMKKGITDAFNKLF